MIGLCNQEFIMMPLLSQINKAFLNIEIYYTFMVRKVKLNIFLSSYRTLQKQCLNYNKKNV